MPQLKDLRQTKIVELPSYPESKVEIYDSLLVSDTLGIDRKESDSVKLSIEVLPLFIKSWNFTNENGEVMPINKENLGFLKQTDAVFLIDAITEFGGIDKKKEK